LITNIPIANSSLLKPDINVFGEPIKKEGNRFKSSITDDPVKRFLFEEKVFVPVPSRQTELDGVQMTQDEYYDYILKSGPKIYDAIKRNIKMLRKKESKDKIQKWISKECREIREDLR